MRTDETVAAHVNAHHTNGFRKTRIAICAANLKIH
jgi:hypothetical protein